MAGVGNDHPGGVMRETIVKNHPLQAIVLGALKTAQSLGENGPKAMARAAKAIVEARPEIPWDEAFLIVWDIWEI